MCWENEDEFWIGISNGHVVRLRVPSTGGDISITDWLTYRFSHLSCISNITLLHRSGRIAVAFADRVEIWQRIGKQCKPYSPPF
jgi:hypothetical protein